MLNRPRGLAGLLAMAALGLAACSDSNSPTNDPLTAQSAAPVGAAMASTADLAVGALSPSVPAFGLGFPLFFSRGRALGGGIQFTPPDSLPNCPAASSLTDTDGDGVPDNATWSFTAADCTQTDIEGNRSVVTGSVVVTDPGLTAGYDLHINNLAAQYYQTGASSPMLQLVMDGDWATRGTSDALSLDQNYNFVLTVNGQRASLANDLTVNFTSAGDPISAGVPLPSGTIDISGAWRVSSSRENHALELTTITPLAYDATCGGIVAGVLDARGTGGNVRVTWTGCGAHTDAYLPAS
jgi:hypothetical protein